MIPPMMLSTRQDTGKLAFHSKLSQVTIYAVKLSFYWIQVMFWSSKLCSPTSAGNRITTKLFDQVQYSKFIMKSFWPHISNHFKFSSSVLWSSSCFNLFHGLLWWCHSWGRYIIFTVSGRCVPRVHRWCSSPPILVKTSMQNDVIASYFVLKKVFSDTKLIFQWKYNSIPVCIY